MLLNDSEALDKLKIDLMTGSYLNPARTCGYYDGFLKGVMNEKEKEKMSLHCCHCSILRKISRMTSPMTSDLPLKRKNLIWSSVTAATFNLKPPFSFPLPSQNAVLHVDAGAEASLRASSSMCPFLP